MIDYNKIQYNFSHELSGVTMDIVSYLYKPDLYVNYVSYLDSKNIKRERIIVARSFGVNELTINDTTTFNIGRVRKKFQEISVELKKAYSLIKSSSISDLII